MTIQDLDTGLYTSREFRRRLAGLLAAYRRREVRREEVGQAVLGWINHVRYGDTWGLRRAMLKKVRL